MSTLKLTNPHSVLAALTHRPLDVLEVRASQARSNEAWKQVIDKAGDYGIPVREPEVQALGNRGKSRDEGGRAGNTFAVVKEIHPTDIKELFASEKSRGLWLAFDQLQDPHNVGAVFRTAAFFGVEGIVMTQDKSAPLTATAYDVASGGIETVRYTMQTNLARAIEIAQKSDMWVLGSSEHASDDIQNIDKNRKWLLVIGNEEKGLRRLTLEKCDMTCQIPPMGEVTSLNVSVAAGIMMATLKR